MDLVLGAMGILADKLFQLLRDEYKLQKDIKVKVESLANDLKSVHVALCKVAQVPYDELDPQVKLWASEAREASYDMEDILDTFFVRVDGCQQPIGADNGKVKNLLKNMDIMLRVLDLDGCSLKNCEGSKPYVGNLIHLRYLGLSKRIQSLNIVDNKNLITWAPFPDLTFLKLYTSTLRTLPKQISPASSPSLARLDMNVRTIEPEDIQILGTLPNLVELILTSDYEDYLEQPMKKFVVSADAFPSLRVCNFVYVVMVPSMFTSGAMLQLNIFRFDLRATDFFINDGLDFDDLAICHLPSLEFVACQIIIEEAATKEEEVTKLMEAVKHAVDVHPNHPTLHLDREIKK